MKIPYCKVIVTRDPMMVISNTVPATEIPCLKVIHGPGRVEAGPPLDEVRETGHEEEYGRLVRRFGNKAGTETLVVEEAYGPSRRREMVDFVKSLQPGVPVGSDLFEEDEDEDDFDPRDALRDRLDDLGVEYDARWGEKRLSDAIAEAEAALEQEDAA